MLSDLIYLTKNRAYKPKVGEMCWFPKIENNIVELDSVEVK